VAEVYTMRDIDERGMRTVMEEALRAAGRGTRAITSRWIWTGSTRRRAGRGTPVRAAPPTAKPLAWRSSRHGRLLSFEIVEVNPVIDEHNRPPTSPSSLPVRVWKKIL